MKISYLVIWGYILALSLIGGNSFAQKGNQIWYFGENAGLDFRNNPPTPLTDGALNTNEGCATITDRDGNLLFYTDGINVWNKNHTLMPNGTGLKGHPSATQSGVIVPLPGSTDIYYIFTIPALESGFTEGLNYSIVDMTLEGGNGDVSSKNNALIAPTTEKITSAVHQNGTDIWVITHTWNNNSFYAYLMTASGIDISPVITSISTNHATVASNAQGYLKSSLDGKKLALARLTLVNGLSARRGIFEIFDFDNASGQITNAISSSTTYYAIYGIEFSPDASKVYFAEGVPIGNSSPNQIYQIDLNAGTNTDILNSVTVIGTSPSIGNSNVGAFQLGRDGKIYVARVGSSYLGLINNPDVAGIGADYVSDGIYLGGKKSRYGLPNFISGPESIGVVLGSLVWNFRANWQNNQVKLSWQANVKSEDFAFVIQKSTNGINYQTIAQLDIANSQSNYHWIDKDINEFNAMVYYRLCQIEKDNQLTIKGLISVRPENESKLEAKIFPNPIRLNQSFEVLLNQSLKTVQVYLLNQEGKIVYQANHTDIKRGNTLQINPGNLKSGTYILQIKNANTQLLKKIVVNE